MNEFLRFRIKYAGLAFLLLMLYPDLAGQKRGLAFGQHSAADLDVLAPEIKWWYNWYVRPENGLDTLYGNLGFDFVPMAWNGSFDESRLRTFLEAHPETGFLLGFNEPNFKDQANMTPTQAASQWHKLEAIADEYGLELVGPAVNFCGNCVQENGVNYSDPVRYLDDFLAACQGCRVDYIAVHSYMNNVGALDWYLGLFKKYGKPIWLTEFAGWEPNGNIQSPNDQISYLIGAVDLLESDSSVFRYAWFTGRGAGSTTYPFIDVLGSSGTVTPLGEIYKKMPVHDPDRRVDVPAIIEAEEYNTMSGILLEKTADVDGFANVGYLDAGDWLEYGIRVAVSGYYPLHFRLASTRNATMKVWIDADPILTVDIPNYQGWQNWHTLTKQIWLDEGDHTWRLEAVTNGFNINWFQIDELTGIHQDAQDEGLIIYPNPNSGRFYIHTGPEIRYLEIYDIRGRESLRLPSSDTEIVTDLTPGVYGVAAMDGMGLIRKYQIMWIVH